MPVIHLTGGTLTREVKAELIRELTRTASRICRIPEPFYTVLLTELPDENLGSGGRSVEEMKAARAVEGS